MLSFVWTVHQMKGEEHRSPQLYLRAQTHFLLRGEMHGKVAGWNAEQSWGPGIRMQGWGEGALTLGSSFYQSWDQEAQRGNNCTAM